eukprot:jgi/Hompol1/5380/HPOL_004361-RA
MAATFKLSDKAYCKLLLHAAKYSGDAVYGVLLGSKTGDAVSVTDTVPLTHTVFVLTPALQVGMEQIEAYAKRSGTQIVGSYSANAAVVDKSVSPAVANAAAQIDSHLGGGALHLLLDAERKNLAVVPFIYKSENWTELPSSQLIADSGAHKKAKALINESAFEHLYDLDNHLEDVSLNWLVNDGIKVPYEEVFRSRPKVIDDRSSSSSSAQSELRSHSALSSSRSPLRAAGNQQQQAKQHTQQLFQAAVDDDDAVLYHHYPLVAQILKQQQQYPDVRIRTAPAPSQPDDGFRPDQQRRSREARPTDNLRGGTNGVVAVPAAASDAAFSDKRLSMPAYKPTNSAGPAVQPTVADEHTLEPQSRGLAGADPDDLSQMLHSSSEMFELRESENRMLDEYKTEILGLSTMSTRIERLHREVRRVSEYFESLIRAEQEQLLPHIVKIQALMRGALVRMELRRQGIVFKRWEAVQIATESDPFEHVSEEERRMLDAAATKIQALWRGCMQRWQIPAEFRIAVLAGMFRQQAEQMRSLKTELQQLRAKDAARDKELAELRQMLERVVGQVTTKATSEAIETSSP